MRGLKERVWYWMRFVVPDPLLRLYEKRRWGRAIDPVPLPDPDRRYRVLITPARHAGQGKQWSDALNRRDDVSARSITVENQGFGHDADYRVSWVYSTLSTRWQRELRRALMSSYTHVLVEASVPPLGGAFGGKLRPQLRWLRRHGLRIGFIAHGSEIRLPSRHRQTEKWSPFHDPDAGELTRVLETIATENLAVYREFAVPAFVSTAGLKADLPQASLLGLVIDIEQYATTTVPLMREKIVATHVSSHSLLKATARLEPLLRRLEAEGWIEFRQYSGIPQDRVPGILSASDIVLDQFALGDYGVFACEGMAAGRLVLSHVSEHVREEIVERTGRELPIPETTLDNLEWRLRDIAAHRERYREIAERGTEFVKRIHGGAFSAQVLYADFLEASEMQ